MQQPHAQSQYQTQYPAQYQPQYSPRQLLESARRAEADGNVDLAAHVSRYVLEHFAGSPESAEAYNSLMRLGQPPIEQAPAPPAAALPVVHGGYASLAPVTPPAARFNAPPRAEQPAPAWPTAPAAAPANGYAAAQAAYAPAPAMRGPAPMPQAPVSGGPYGAQMQTPAQAIAANFAPSAPYRGGAEPSSPAMIHHAPEVTPQYRGGRIVARLAFAAGGLMIVAGVMTPLSAFMGLIGASPSLIGIGLVACALIATGLLALLGGQTALAVFDQADNMRELVELERTRWNG